MTAEESRIRFWSEGLHRRVTRADRWYPTALAAALGPAAPPVLTVLGNPEALWDDPVALLCSESCPPGIVLRAYDLACELASRDLTVVGGFHSAVERECLRVLLTGRKPVIWCPARGLGPRLLAPGHARAVTDGRLVVATPFTRCARRVTRPAARWRNRVVAALARGLVVLHAEEGGDAAACCRLALGWGRPVRLLDARASPGLLEQGALPLASGELPGWLPAWARRAQDAPQR